MKIYHCSDSLGRTTEVIEYDEQETMAIEEAHRIAEARFAECCMEYTRDLKEQVSWCFDAALKLGGIPELMRYVTESKISMKKRVHAVGYAGYAETEDRK